MALEFLFVVCICPVFLVRVTESSTFPIIMAVGALVVIGELFPRLANPGAHLKLPPTLLKKIQDTCVWPVCMLCVSFGHVTIVVVTVLRHLALSTDSVFVCQDLVLLL
ncbi:hypothetical protein NQD34_010253 [Periophthalmus magnuspinnatus]|nr:hypothetical protein NQD34_010253 [Periophthalmus magnuspinnatus]